MKLLASKEFLCFLLMQKARVRLAMSEFDIKRTYLCPLFLCISNFLIRESSRNTFLSTTLTDYCLYIYREISFRVTLNNKNCERHKGLPICVFSLLCLCRLSLGPSLLWNLKCLDINCGYVPSVNVSYLKMMLIQLLNKTGMIIQCENYWIFVIVLLQK